MHAMRNLNFANGADANEDSGTFDHHDHGQMNKSENFGSEKVYCIMCTGIPFL